MAGSSPMPDADNLSLADPSELADALVFALRFRGRDKSTCERSLLVHEFASLGSARFPKMVN